MRDPQEHPLPTATAAFVATFWAGMLAGVSFLATPVKFQAASLSLPTALEVGSITFWTFSHIEWGLALLLAGAVVFSPASRTARVGALLAAALVIVEGAWLLPALDARVAAIIAGTPVSPSSHHLLYAAAEGVKLLALCAVAVAALYRLGSNRPGQIELLEFSRASGDGKVPTVAPGGE